MLSANSPRAVRSLAVLGSPIAHSRSPRLHRAAYAVLGLPWSYDVAEVDSAGLAGYLESRDASWRGLSLTMPLKYEAIALADSLDRTAALTGAANTLLFDHTGDTRILRGFNTDVPGIVRALAAAGVTRARHVLVLGGGATAASAVAAAAELGAEHVTIRVRERARATGLVALAASVGTTASLEPLVAHPNEHAGTPAPAPAAMPTRSLVAPDLVVSTVPGHALDTERARAIIADEVLGQAASTGATLLDAAYDPWPTPIAAAWEARSGVTLSGLAMLVQQALLQVRVFVTGDPLIELDEEATVLSAMFDAVGLDERGAVVGDGRDI